MKQDRETRNKLLESARAEFLDKGYMKASLRSICKNAGVTTGALYFFFENKEDLFDALTEDVIGILYRTLSMHFERERQLQDEELLQINQEDDFEEDMEAAKQIIHQMYLRREDILLVLTKSQGTKHEDIVDRFIELAEKHYRIMADKMQKASGSAAVSDTVIHWLSHVQIDTFVYMIVHIEEEQEAFAYMEKAVIYMISGWYGMFKCKD